MGRPCHKFEGTNDKFEDANGSTIGATKCETLRRSLCYREIRLHRSLLHNHKSEYRESVGFSVGERRCACKAALSLCRVEHDKKWGQLKKEGEERYTLAPLRADRAINVIGT